ncbi:sphingosine hydroxylase KNAG_0B04760 [Huiozyma naganishii CBS 8797]|uniref:Fatty acid hydroxylase domain-containing protein n=1 Tax=Huiozyma naganishii (strain ATCC MYA-139 / BCRC 22969 / CBS 8797 / KCTC 17520 / NBRC 10181 / NCYC 3082 / Yp74L-3) TaxID=1071383 RepID=J7S505_HUIN7|nr:hypothetical protein KNAG_0B04760 [Kazachstania naganishii CBS 8797]CCK68911.1 hypothetical protein KNAG_0B04760 [Kazachstania naganishii CBS 8797]
MNSSTEAVNATAETLFNGAAGKQFSFMYSSVAPAKHIVPRPSLVEGIPDGILALIAPVVAYWVVSGFFHLLDTFNLAEKYRIHPSAEVKSRNKAGRLEVLREVILQHCIQTLFGLTAYKFDAESVTGFEAYEMWHLKKDIYSFIGPQFASMIKDQWIVLFYKYGLSLIKLSLAFIFVDTWQFFLHYLMHYSSTLYKKFHSRHHQLYVPYAYGALFNAPTEGFLLDTLGTGIAMIVTRLSPREQIVLFTFATMKTVDDHCGYVLPFDPFQIFFPNNAVYHDIHHQEWGLKSNFAQPFFTFWDTVFGTRFPALKEMNTKKVNIHQYKQFLLNRDEERKVKLEKMKKVLEKDDE